MSSTARHQVPAPPTPLVSPPEQADVRGHPGQPWLPPASVVTLPGRGEVFTRVMPGPADLAPVVLLHGWGVTADLNWFPVLGALRGRRTVVAPDLREHGRGIVSERRFSLEDCADDVAALLDVLDFGPAVVVGYSMGGAVAQLFEARHPDRTAGTVLVATALHWRGLHRRALIYRSGWDMATQRSTGGRWFGHRLVSRAARRTPDVAPLRPWLVAELERGHPGGLRQAGRAIAGFRGDRLAPVGHAPNAVVVTTRDRMVGPSRQRRLAAHRGARVFELAGNHDAAVTEAHAFARTTVEAVDWVTSTRPTSVPA